MNKSISQPFTGQGPDNPSNFCERVKKYCGVLNLKETEMLRYEKMDVDEENLTDLLDNDEKFYFFVFFCMDKEYLTSFLTRFSETLKSRIRNGVKDMMKTLGILTDVVAEKSISHDEKYVRALDSSDSILDYLEGWRQGFMKDHWLLNPDDDPRHLTIVHTECMVPERWKTPRPAINHLEPYKDWFSQAVSGKCFVKVPSKSCTKGIFVWPWDFFHDKQVKESALSSGDPFVAVKDTASNFQRQLVALKIGSQDEDLLRKDQDHARKLAEFCHCYGISTDSPYCEFLYMNSVGFCDMPYDNLKIVLESFHCIVMLKTGAEIRDALENVDNEDVRSALVWLLHGCLEDKILDEFVSLNEASEIEIVEEWRLGQSFLLHTLQIVEFCKSYGVPTDSPHCEYLLEKFVGLCDLHLEDLKSVLALFQKIVTLKTGQEILDALFEAEDNGKRSAVTWLIHGCIDERLFDEFYFLQSVHDSNFTDMYLEGRFWLHMFLSSPDGVRKSILEILRVHQPRTMEKMKFVCGSNTHSRYVHFFNKWVSLYYVNYHQYDHPLDMKVRCLKEWEPRVLPTMVMTAEEYSEYQRSEKRRKT